MATYEPKQRRAIAQQLARLVEEGGRFLCDDIAIYLSQEAELSLIDSIGKYGRTNTRERLERHRPDSLPCDSGVGTADEIITTLSKITL